MKVLTIGLLVYAMATTITIVGLGTLLSKCKNKVSMDRVEGSKTSVEKEEYGIFLMDNSEEGNCQCNDGIAKIGWTILEIIVTSVLGMMALAMLLKGVMMGVVAIKEKKLKRIVEEQERQKQMRDQIRMEERSKQRSNNEEAMLGMDNTNEM